MVSKNLDHFIEIFEDSPDIVFFYSKDFQMIKANSSFYNELKYEKERSDLLMLKHLTDKKGLKSFVRPKFNKKFIFNIKDFQGVIHYLEGYIIPLIELDINIVVSRDITKFREQNKLLSEIEFYKALSSKDSKQHITFLEKINESIINHIPNAICWKNTESIHLGCNNIYAELLGMSIKEIIGEKNISPLWSKESLDKIHSYEISVLKTNDKISNVIEKFPFPNRKTLIFDISIVPLLDGYNKIVGTLTSLRDITDRMKSEEKLMNLRVEQKQKEFYDLISHEMKIPSAMLKTGAKDSRITINKILGQLDDLPENEESSETFELLRTRLQRLEKLNTSMEHGATSVEKVLEKQLNLAMTEDGIIELDIQPINLNRILEKCLELSQELSNIRETQFLIDLENPMIIECDEAFIQFVFDNLIHNAIKYTPPKGVVRIYSEILNDSIKIFIEDTGAGFTEEELKKVFVKGMKFQRMGDYIIEGKGIGLYSVREWIRLHKGEIHVDSKGRDNGSIFTIILPKKQS